MKYRKFALLLVVGWCSYASSLLADDSYDFSQLKDSSYIDASSSSEGSIDNRNKSDNDQSSNKPKKKKNRNHNSNGNDSNFSYNDGYYNGPHPYYGPPPHGPYGYGHPHPYYNNSYHPNNGYAGYQPCCPPPHCCPPPQCPPMHCCPPPPCHESCYQPCYSPCQMPCYGLPNYCEQSCNSCSCWGSEPRILNGYIAHTEGKGLGYTIGYTTLGLFYMPQNWNFPDFRPFIDLRGHVFNNGRWAANAGLGLRYIVPCWNTVLGVNVYYDYLQHNNRRLSNHLSSDNNYHYRNEYRNLNQVSFGLEALNPCFDLRLNAYFPVSSKSVWGHHDEEAYGLFKLVSRNKRWALAGFDAEIGTNLYQRRPWACSNWFDLYGAIGPYYYSSKHGNDIVGGRARLIASFTEYLTLEGIATYDSVYRWGGQGKVSLNFPIGPQNVYIPRCDCCDTCCLDTLAVQPVIRNDIILLGKNRKCYHWETNCNNPR